MIVFAPVTVLGGLGVIAEVDFPPYETFGIDPSGWNPEPSVVCLYWPRRGGSTGTPLSDAIMRKIERDEYWQADVIEQASEAHAFSEHGK